MDDVISQAMPLVVPFVQAIAIVGILWALAGVGHFFSNLGDTLITSLFLIGSRVRALFRLATPVMIALVVIIGASEIPRVVKSSLLVEGRPKSPGGVRNEIVDAVLQITEQIPQRPFYATGSNLFAPPEFFLKQTDVIAGVLKSDPDCLARQSAHRVDIPWIKFRALEADALAAAERMVRTHADLTGRIGENSNSLRAWLHTKAELANAAEQPKTTKQILDFWRNQFPFGGTYARHALRSLARVTCP
ncbi:MAG: hypothetical protein KBA31_13085 [Alphaproteobacteria bacterium]|nr:hypothetical protein [Alphaproteobacteria bacterium]